ncbi:hypothetical protein C8F04DRAFT_1184478 [Mycena alexandri]|uniref:Uncharacterized protein n=1 Tax=Mycena alexandri TaxID=1745969 RepID=A0AAD6SSB7_9AGAR|nr:hypothetical protein C8F04DRAFT_1184478 [Mycena alexandri]
MNEAGRKRHAPNEQSLSQSYPRPHRGRNPVQLRPEGVRAKHYFDSRRIKGLNPEKEGLGVHSDALEQAHEAAIPRRHAPHKSTTRAKIEKLNQPYCTTIQLNSTFKSKTKKGFQRAVVTEGKSELNCGPRVPNKQGIVLSGSWKPSARSIGVQRFEVKFDVFWGQWDVEWQVLHELKICTARGLNQARLNEGRHMNQVGFIELKPIRVTQGRFDY